MKAGVDSGPVFPPLPVHCQIADSHAVRYGTLIEISQQSNEMIVNTSTSSTTKQMEHSHRLLHEEQHRHDIA
jgi:hypothetical protein